MMRRATPDSEAVASSEDEKPWPHSTFGSLPRKENGVPGFGGGIWAQSQPRKSFTLTDQARRIAAREVRLSGVVDRAHPSARSANTPSPVTSEGANQLPFAIPLQPNAKTGRSLSHSQGQREMPAGLNAQAMDRANALPLGLLNEAEEIDTDSESDLGAALTQTMSHPPIGTFQRTATYPTQFEAVHPSRLDQGRAETFNEALLQGGLGKHFESALGNPALDQIPRSKQRWQTASGWDELHTINESRRHSLAGELPTRRGSLVASQEPTLQERSQLAYQDQFQLHRPLSNHSNTTSNSGFRSMDRHEPFQIPDGYRVPHVTLEPHERAEMRQSLNMQPNSRPRKMLYIVSFKCSRVGVFYLLDNTGLTVGEGDMVIVEADRGQDLGTVQHARVTSEEARALLQKYGEEQYKWLMMFSRNNTAGAVNPNAAVYGESSGQDYSTRPNMPSTRPPRDVFLNLKPKAIKRMAADHEIRMLKEKEGNEAKAKRCCQQKVFQHHLDMEILEAEFQWDWQKLIFYYYADHYVNFKELVNDLYKLYKVRLWMSAVNPASFSPNAINQPPSGIGPGAVTNFDPYRQEVDHSYAMTYGSDPDPYGAIPPYQIGYNTYVPNYPSIPGMSNSFAPVPGDGTPARPAHGHWPEASGAQAGNTPGVTAPAPATHLGMGFLLGDQYSGNGHGHGPSKSADMRRFSQAHDGHDSGAGQVGNMENLLSGIHNMSMKEWQTNPLSGMPMSTTGGVGQTGPGAPIGGLNVQQRTYAAGNINPPRRPAFNPAHQPSYPAGPW